MYYESVQQKKKEKKKRKQNVTINISVQYMALCNTVHYSYGKYMKDKVRHYKLWQNMLDNQISQ